MTNIPQKYQNLLDNFPFLSLCTYGGQEYIGIVQNTDNQVCSVYVYDLVEPELRKSFLELSEEWWWESNRTISINLVIGKRFKPFRMALMPVSGCAHALVIDSVLNRFPHIDATTCSVRIGVASPSLSILSIML